MNFSFFSSAVPKIRLATSGFSRTQHSGIPGYGQNPPNLRNSGVTAQQTSVFPNQVFQGRGEEAPFETF
jgi:hypothetical protein